VTMSTVACRVRVHGRVQGVFFRDACSSEARARGVVGWVRNDDDGTVTAHFEGSLDAVEAMVDWCRSGSPRAQVREVEQRDVDPEGHRDFTVV
jgi:acylphosphatase